MNETSETDWTVVGPMLARLFADYLAAERARKGLSTEEIFARAGAKLDANEAKLLADLERLK